MKKLIMIISLCLFYLAGIAQQAAVDVITLKNGSVIRGKIIEQTGQVIKIYTTNRSMVEVKPEEVEKMSKEANTTTVAQSSGSTFDEDSFTKGNMIIAGSGYLMFDKDKGAPKSTLGISVDPTVAYFITDGLAVGASIPLSFSSTGGQKAYSIGIGPVIRYYTDYMAVFKFEGGYEFTHYPTAKRGAFYLKPAVGMAIFLNPKVCLEPSIFYQYAYQKVKYDTYDTSAKNNAFGIEVGLTIFL
jgi:hypothetical protein